MELFDKRFNQAQYLCSQLLNPCWGSVAHLELLRRLDERIHTGVSYPDLFRNQLGYVPDSYNNMLLTFCVHALLPSHVQYPLQGLELLACSHGCCLVTCSHGPKAHHWSFSGAHGRRLGTGSTGVGWRPTPEPSPRAKFFWLCSAQNFWFTKIKKNILFLMNTR